MKYTIIESLRVYLDNNTKINETQTTNAIEHAPLSIESAINLLTKAHLLCGNDDSERQVGNYRIECNTERGDNILITDYNFKTDDLPLLHVLVSDIFTAIEQYLITLETLKENESS